MVFVDWDDKDDSTHINGITYMFGTVCRHIQDLISVYIKYDKYRNGITNAKSMNVI